MGGLDYDDKLELEEQTDLVAFEEAPMREGASGEAVTLIAVVGGIALKGLIAFLVMRSSKDRFKKRIEVEYPDGRRVVYTVEFEMVKDRPVEEQVMDALSELSGVPVPELTA
ncbi:hypothetical protein [Nonomuraea basaltis]|uniref:hypothetical protein n=1 Tax=Nonomuraea basaltis TaxID=2495887 RepID=UPI00110C510A|nr:hypothetical protein [Nonomuraea basaltis]TMR94277.1 hypothetical protein EJK15_34875 [Nonomuraea basaltis]